MLGLMDLRRWVTAVGSVLALSTVGTLGAATPVGAQATGPARTQQALTPDHARYLVDLASNDRGDQWHGTEQVVFTNTGSEPLAVVWLRLWGNGRDGCTTPPDVTVSDMRGGTAGELAVDCSALPVTLREPLAPSASTLLSFDLTIAAPERADRFGHVGDFSFLGNALPLLAVHDETGWQLPPYVTDGESFYSLTSDFVVSLDHPSGIAVPATGVAVAESPHGDRTTTRILAPRVRDFAWTAGPFRSSTTRTSTGVTLRTWWPPDVADDAALAVQGDVARAMEFDTAQYGSYPYPEFDTVIGGFQGFSGMEYPTLILTDPAELPAVHEVGHQWWYSLVGNDQYHNPWLDESLTHYTTTKLIGIPGYCQAAPFWFEPAMRMDDGMDYYGSRPDEYAPGVYGDGACMFHELERMIGPAAMQTALRGYLAAHEYGVARPADLRGAFQSVTTVDLGPFWERWRNTAN